MSVIREGLPWEESAAEGCREDTSQSAAEVVSVPLKLWQGLVIWLIGESRSTDAYGCSAFGW